MTTTIRTRLLLAIVASLSLLAGSVVAQNSHETALRNMRFRSIGPSVMGGRLDDFAVVESDPRIVYVGTAAGGILKTTNAGLTWTPITDDAPGSPSIGDIALAPSNPAILYVGTGEANNRQSSSWGDGVYKSTDAGRTWKFIGLKETRHIGRIAVHPTDPDIALVAAEGDLWGPSKERGVYMTTDGGATWKQTLFLNEDTGVSDVAIDPQSPNIVFACAYERRRTVYGFSGGGPGSGIYRSTDGGRTWTKLARGLPTQGDVGRCAVDIYRKNSNIVYVLIQHATFGGIYRSGDRGATFTRMSETNPRPSYYSQVRIDPNNPDHVWVLGAPLYESIDGGRTFVNRQVGIHSDFHAFWIDPANSDHIWAGSDGGITVTWDGARTWDNINNFPMGQFYEVAYDFQTPFHVCGGLQDNNTFCGPSSLLMSRGPSNGDWYQVGGGDGFHVRIDPKDPSTLYVESQDGNLSRRDLNSSVTKSIRPEEDAPTAARYRFQWNSPLIISPHDNHTIYYGGNYLFKSTDRGDTWERLADKDLTNNVERNSLPILGKLPTRQTTLSLHDGVVHWPCITAIAESPVTAGVLWAGTDDGNLNVSRDGGKTWTNVAAKIPGLKGAGKDAYVSRIEASYQEAGAAYVAFDNHRSSDFSVYIYMTRDFGNTWTKITNGIPPEAGTVHVVREDPHTPNLLFAGLEFGLYVSFDRGQKWERLKNGLPPTPVFDLQIHPRDHALILATHGRSLWIMDDIAPLEEMDDAALASDLKFFTPMDGVEWRIANYRAYNGSRDFTGANPPAGVQLDYYTKSAGPVIITIKDKSGATVSTIKARAQAGVINRTNWGLTADNPLAALLAAGRGGVGAPGQASPAAPGAAAAVVVPAPPTISQPPSPTPEEAGEPAGGGGVPAAGGGRGAPVAPAVDPGEYTITIAAAGQTQSKTVRVEDDPRITWFSAADRAKRKAVIDRLVSMAKDANTGRQKLLAMQTALTDLIAGWARPAAPKVPDDIKKAANGILDGVKEAAVKFQLPQPPSDAIRELGGAGAQPPYVPPAILTRITTLLTVLQGYPSAPNARQLKQSGDLSAELQKDLADAAKLDAEIPRLNKMLQEAHIEYFTIDPSSVAPPALGGRGGQ